MTEKIKQLLDSLSLKGMTTCLDDILMNAERQGTATSDVLLELLEAEYRDKQERCLESRLKRAKLPWDWTIDTFPFADQPGVKKTQIMGLAKLTFMERNENIIFIGKAGTGKSGIAMSLLRLALLNGYRGRFYNAQDLLNELYSSLADRTTSSLLKTLASYDLVVIDELGYLTLTTEQINIFLNSSTCAIEKSQPSLRRILTLKNGTSYLNKKSWSMLCLIDLNIAVPPFVSTARA